MNVFAVQTSSLPLRSVFAMVMTVTCGRTSSFDELVLTTWGVMETKTAETTLLRSWRLSNGLSIDELSDLTGVSKSMLSRTERGQRDLAPLTKAKVARRLGVPIRDLFEVSDAAA